MTFKVIHKNCDYWMDYEIVINRYVVWKNKGLHAYRLAEYEVSDEGLAAAKQKVDDLASEARQ